MEEEGIIARAKRLRAKSKGGKKMKDRVKGKAEEVKGKLTGNRTLETKGKLRQAGDKLRRDVRDVKADLRGSGKASR